MIPYRQQVRHKSLIKYKGKQPSVELIRACIEKAGVSRARFELIYGITPKAIQRYEKGLRLLPLDYWHIFYEFDHLEKFYATFKLAKKKAIKKQAKAEVPIVLSKHKSVLDAYRQQFNRADDTGS